MIITLSLVVALIAAIISTATYPRPISYPAAGVAAASLIVIAALLVRDHTQYFAAVLVLALALVLAAWTIAECLDYADRRREEGERAARARVRSPRRLIAHRTDLTGHTITVEPLAGGRAVIERMDGAPVKVCTTAAELRPGVTLEKAARSYAAGYGAVYVPERSPRAAGAVEDAAGIEIAGGAR